MNFQRIQAKFKYLYFGSICYIKLISVVLVPLQTGVAKSTLKIVIYIKIFIPYNAIFDGEN